MSKNILPPMIAAASLIVDTNPEVQFVLVLAPNRSPAEAQELLARRSSSFPLHLVEEQTREALLAADAAAIASGTATLEAALLGTPMVIGYKETWLNWNTLGRLTHPDHYGLPNLLARRRMFTELIQNDLNGERLAAEIVALLDKKNQDLRHQLSRLKEEPGEADASQRAAEQVLDALRP